MSFFFLKINADWSCAWAGEDQLRWVTSLQLRVVSLALVLLAGANVGSETFVRLHCEETNWDSEGLFDCKQ